MKVSHTIKIQGESGNSLTLDQIRELVGHTDDLPGSTKLILRVGRFEQRDPYPDSITIDYEGEL